MDTLLTQYSIYHVKRLYDNHIVRFIWYIVRYNVYQHNKKKYDITSYAIINENHMIQNNTVINYHK